MSAVVPMPPIPMFCIALSTSPWSPCCFAFANGRRLRARWAAYAAFLSASRSSHDERPFWTASSRVFFRSAILASSRRLR